MSRINTHRPYIACGDCQKSHAKACGTVLSFQQSVQIVKLRAEIGIRRECLSGHVWQWRNIVQPAQILHHN